MCSLVARDDAQVLGWAALSSVSTRSVYVGVAEVSLYVACAARDRGIGSLLMQALIDCSETHGFWTLQAVVFPENEASIHLHQKHGFKLVGIRERLGRMETGEYRGQWWDVLLLERRSKIVGADSQPPPKPQKEAISCRADSCSKSASTPSSQPLPPRRAARSVSSCATT